MTSRMVATLALAVLASGCASRAVRRQDVAALAAADAQVAQGCHECLVEARSTYERLSASRYVPPDSVARRLFEVHLLLSLRAKELQLDWRESLERARGVAPRVPAHIDAARVLAIADAVVPDGSGRMNDWTAPFRRERAAFVRRVPDEVRWISMAPLSPPVREYLALALDCAYEARVLAPVAQPGSTVRRPVLLPDATPLVMYRTGICLSPDTNMLAAVMAHEPRFHEAAYFAGMMAAFRSEEDGGERAASLLARALERFPRSPAIAYISGWSAMSVNDCEGANRFFDAAVAIDAAHELALLEGTACRSRLRQDSAAIAWANRVIALGAVTRQQGYYWRAVSRYRLREIDSARADIEVAKRLEREPNALTIAGVIENDQNDLAVAEQDLRAARALHNGDTNCTAAWTLGLVIGKAGRPAEAAETFEASMVCYEIRLADVRIKIRRILDNPPRNAAFALKRLDALASDSLDLRQRFHASAFNAAGHKANAGDIEKALALLGVASQDLRLAEPVEKLRSAIAAIRAR